jgi:hypothetical protein
MIYVAPDKRVKLPELEDMEVEKPNEAGSYWVAVPHTALIHAILDQARTYDWKIKLHQMFVSANKKDMVATFLVPKMRSRSAVIRQIGSLCPSFGVMTSNSGHSRTKYFSGLTDVDTGCGFVNPTVLICKKRTHRSDIEREICRGITTGAKATRVFNVRKAFMDRRIILMHEMSEIMVKAAQKGAMPWKRIPNVQKAFIATERSAWDLLACFAKEAMRMPPLKQLPRLALIRTIINQYVTDWELSDRKGSLLPKHMPV